MVNEMAARPKSGPRERRCMLKPDIVNVCEGSTSCSSEATYVVSKQLEVSEVGKLSTNSPYSVHTRSNELEDKRANTVVLKLVDRRREEEHL